MNMDPQHSFFHTKRFFRTAGIWALCLVASLVVTRLVSAVFDFTVNPAIVVALSFTLSVAALVMHARKGSH
jgi:hypothetical protein